MSNQLGSVFLGNNETFAAIPIGTGVYTSVKVVPAAESSSMDTEAKTRGN